MAPFDGLLARRVDVGDDEDVGLVECAGELVEKQLGARVAVGLKGDDDAAIEAALGSVERGFDLGGVVAVVVDDHHVAAPPVAFERRLSQRP